MWEMGVMKERREKGEIEFAELVKADEMDRKERLNKIRESKYNRWYGRIKGKGMPSYLKKRKDGKEWQNLDWGME